MRIRVRFAWTGVFLVLVALLTPLAAAPANAAAVTVFVGPSRMIKTIQAGIDAAANGDTVRVDAKGSDYVENVVIRGKYVTLMPTSGPVTIRAASARNAALQILDAPSNPDFRNDVAGFTITGGVGYDGQGGGVTIFNSSPELRNCIISGNRSEYGGGVLVYLNSNPFIHDNIIRDNDVSLGGGGIFVNKNSAPTIVRNQITNNRALGPWVGDPNGGSSGAGIYMLNEVDNPNAYVQPVILGNTISNNVAKFAGGGMMILTGINAIIEDNTFDSNMAAYGGGIHIESKSSQPVIDSNRITNNVATSTDYADGGQGGGISVYNQSRPTISNNSITGNRSTKGGGAITAGEYSTSTISGNLISGNATGKMGDGSNADGGGLYVAYASVTVTNNVFVSNSAENNGGAISVIAMVNGGTTYSADISHNTIARNIEPSVWGGAIYVGSSAGGKVALTNNILTLNQGSQIFEPVALARIDNNLVTSPGVNSESGGGLYYNYTDHGLNTAAALNNNAHVNAANNIVAGTQFVDVARNDFRLASTSSAVGAATVSAAPTVALDLRGVQRSTPPDIGAYEYDAQPVVLAAPVLSGSPEVSATLMVTPGTWGPAPGVVSYQWYVGGQAVPGANGGVFDPRVEDVGKQVSVVVTCTKYGIYESAFTSQLTGPVVRGSHFADVPTSQTFYAPITWMYESGVSTGSPNEPYAPLFKPTDPVSRQAMALFLYRASGETFAPSIEPVFADVSSEDSPLFYTAIEWMFSKGISTGTAQPDGKALFKPGEPVSREVMGVFLARFASADVSVAPATQSFADVPIDSQNAATLTWMKTAGISTGTAQPTGLPLYKPRDPVSRQALSAFLFRLVQLR